VGVGYQGWLVLAVLSADRPDDQGDEGLAPDRPAGTGLRQRHGRGEAIDAHGGSLGSFNDR